MKKQKQLDLSKGEMENSTHRRCTQVQCGYYLEGNCKNCSQCSSPPFVIKKSCNICDCCENKSGFLRWQNNNIDLSQAQTQEVPEVQIILTPEEEFFEEEVKPLFQEEEMIPNGR